MMNKLVWLAMLALPGIALAEQPAKGSPEAMFEANFKRVDANRDGGLSKAETEKGAPGLAQHFDEADADHDGKLSKQEVLGFMADKREEAVKRFTAADKDGNGALSKDEARVLPGIAAHYDEMDADRNGQVTPREITDYVRSQQSGTTK